MISFKELMEDVYAADRKEKQWIDPATGKTKKRSIQAHRIQFAASKLHQSQDAKDARPDYLTDKGIKRPEIETDRPVYLQTKRVKEEMEQNKDLENTVQEVLSKNAPAGEWIHDFVHSDNPKFEGKSKKEQIGRAHV